MSGIFESLQGDTPKKVVDSLRLGAGRLECLPVEIGEVRSTVATAAEWMRRGADMIERLCSIAGKADVGDDFNHIKYNASPLRELMQELAAEEQASAELTSELRHQTPDNG